MKPGTTLLFSIAVACLAFCTPQLVCAQGAAEHAARNMSKDGVPYPGTIQDPTLAKKEAAFMVPAKVHLVKALDAKKAQAGSQFEAIVDRTIELKNGTELPHRTVLLGKVAADQMNPDGTSRLALRFTKARLKNGSTIPIRAMITGIAGPTYDSGYSSSAQVPPPWNKQTLQVDQIGALSGIDMHSRIAGANSGVFISTKKDDVKLAAGSQMTLAIGAANQMSGAKSGA